MCVNINEIRITDKPKNKHLTEISEWINECNHFDISISSDWMMVKTAFTQNNLIVATHNNKVIGFFVVRVNTYVGKIELAQTKNDYRKIGVCKLILESVIEKLKEKEVYALHLVCAKKSLKNVWEKMGFKIFPNNKKGNRYLQNIDNPKMFRILKQNLLCFDSVNKNNEKELIEIWNDEPYMFNNNEKPNWVWLLEYVENTKTLLNPIIHFSSSEWRIRHRKGDTIFYDGKIKHFVETKFYYSLCTIIKEIKSNG